MIDPLMPSSNLICCIPFSQYGLIYIGEAKNRSGGHFIKHLCFDCQVLQQLVVNHSTSQLEVVETAKLLIFEFNQ